MLGTGKLAGAYAILRAFSWQIRLSPFLFEELCAAFCSPKSSPLLDEIFLCILRTFAQDENKDHRATRLLDLNNLDYITWFEYVWEWLRLTENPLSAKYSSFSHSKKEISSPQASPNFFLLSLCRLFQCAQGRFSIIIPCTKFSK